MLAFLAVLGSASIKLAGVVQPVITGAFLGSALVSTSLAEVAQPVITRVFLEWALVSTSLAAVAQPKTVQASQVFLLPLSALL